MNFLGLSIVFLAVEIIKNLDGRQILTSKKLWLIAITFCLLHGFGGALSDIGLPQMNIPWALAFINVGVEIDQIAFATAILVIVKKNEWPIYVRKIPAYAIGSIASFWMIERLLRFWK